MNKISQGKRIVHFCNYSPLDSGIYPETRDLIYEELRVGYDSWLIDNTNTSGKDDVIHDQLWESGRIINFDDDDKTEGADLICWHSWLPDKYMNDRTAKIIMFLHAMPSHLFYNELYGGEKVLSFLKKASDDLPNCRNFITLWPTHRPYWEHIFKQRLITTQPILDCESIHLKPHSLFDKSHLKLVIMDSWRGGKEPYYIFNSVQILMDKYHKGEIPFKVTLDIYGQDADHIQPVWYTLMREGFEDYFIFKGRDFPQNIFDTHDILLTQEGEMSTESRVIREGLLSGIPIVSGISFSDWAEFKHDCRDIEGYADQILRCYEQLEDRDKRIDLHNKNREFACIRFDIQKNIEPVFQCYETIFSKSKNPDIGKNTGPDFDKLITIINEGWDEQTGLDGLQEYLSGENEFMTKEEAIIRLMNDLPVSG